LDEKALALVIQTGYYLRGKKRLDGAMRVFSALEKAYPRRAFPHMGLGLVLAEQGQVIEAQARFGRVIARVQGHSMALFAMAFCRMEAGMPGWRDLLVQCMHSEDGFGGQELARSVLRASDRRRSSRDAETPRPVAVRLGAAPDINKEIKQDGKTRHDDIGNQSR